MKILHIVAGLDLGGAETMLVNLVSSSISNNEYYFLCFGKKRDFFYTRKIESMGGKIIFIDKPKPQNPMKHIRDLKQLYSNYGGFDIAHVHTLLHSGIVSYALRNQDTTIITHAHSSADNSKKRGFIRSLYESFSKTLIKRYSDVFLYCSELAKDYLFPKITESDSLIRFNNSIKLENYIINSKLSSTNKIVISMIGRFEEVKNHKFIVEVLEKIETEGKDVLFNFVGDGKLKDQIMRKSEKISTPIEMKFLGARNDVNDILKHTDILVMPSKYEGFPMVLLEAQAASCHCIVSDRIDDSVDLGLGTIDFLSIDDTKLWKIYIEKNLKGKSLLDAKKIKSIYSKNGFDSKTASNIIQEIYIKNRKRKYK